jgi:hypothetical protein
MTTEPPADTRPASKLAWASLVCGILSWALSPVVPFGLDAAAVVLGILALKLTDGVAKKERRIAKIGLWAGLLKLLATALILAWVVVAFMKNPVAH